MESNAPVTEHGKQVKKDAAAGETSKSGHASDSGTRPYGDPLHERLDRYPGIRSA